MVGFIATKRQIGRILLIALFVILLLCTVLWRAKAAKAATQLPQNAVTQEQRIALVEQLGYLVEKSVPEQAQTVQLPWEFSEIYTSYHTLQQQAGFDLTPYAGKQIVCYTLKIKDSSRSDVYAHLLVDQNSLIGGDIAAIAVKDGFMLPFIKKE